MFFFTNLLSLFKNIYCCEFLAYILGMGKCLMSDQKHWNNEIW